MAIYAIGDLHLSLGTDKPMDVFGGSWDNYVMKIKDGFSFLNEDDICVICGDITWAMSLENSLSDFKFIDALPGKKIILKGNHDYWWSTASKTAAFFLKNGIQTIEILNNNCYFADNIAICGTRGWFYEEDTDRARETHTTPEVTAGHDKKIMDRELLRLSASLKAADAQPAAEKICFLHYPPVFKNYICRDIIDIMKNNGVKSCWYGHIHGQGHRYAVTGEYDGITYHMVSADFVKFTPVKVK
jgi:uncharacterized protein